MSKKNKRSRNIFQPFPVNNKVPVHEVDVEQYKNQNFNWTINTQWLCSPFTNCTNPKTCKAFCFSFEKLTSEELFSIFKKLDSYRSWTWKKIESSQNGSSTGLMDVYRLDVKEMVENHLKTKHLEDHDKLYKIEIKGSHRVWGIREENTLFLLWNDSEHRFYKHQNKNYTKPQQ